MRPIFLLAIFTLLLACSEKPSNRTYYISSKSNDTVRVEFDLGDLSGVESKALSTHIKDLCDENHMIYHDAVLNCVNHSWKPDAPLKDEMASKLTMSTPLAREGQKDLSESDIHEGVVSFLRHVKKTTKLSSPQGGV